MLNWTAMVKGYTCKCFCAIWKKDTTIADSASKHTANISAINDQQDRKITSRIFSIISLAAILIWNETRETQHEHKCLKNL